MVPPDPCCHLGAAASAAAAAATSLGAKMRPLESLNSDSHEPRSSLECEAPEGHLCSLSGYKSVLKESHPVECVGVPWACRTQGTP